jgi:lactoylglutathione lyase
MDVIHTAVWVSDLEEARSFFVDGVGLDERRSFSDGGVENVYVGGETGAIQLRHDSDRDAPAPDRSTLDHIALSVADVDAECERIVDETGCDVVAGPTAVPAADASVAVLDGPDGYVIELVETGDP